MRSRREGVRVGNRRPPPRGRAGRPRRDPPPPHRLASRGGTGPHFPRQRGWSPLPLGETVAPERGVGARPAPPPQPPAPTGTAENKRTRANVPGRHTDHARRRQASTNRSGMEATPSMTRTTPVTPTLLPAQGRQGDGTRQSNPAPYLPPRPHKQGAHRTGRPPPPPPHPPARERPGHADQPHGERTTPSQVGGKRDRAAPPPRHDKRSKGPGQDTRRGTDRVERPYQRQAPGPRKVRAPHQPGEGGGARTPRERERTHTQTARGEYQKGNRTELAERTDRVEWRTSERGYGTPGQDGPPHTGRDTGAGRGKRGRHDTRHRPEPPEPAATAAHTRPGHCTRQGSSGALRHAPTPRLGSHRASPRGSHWRQASSTDPAAPAPRANTH